jgi:hypothetical protein
MLENADPQLFQAGIIQILDDKSAVFERRKDIGAAIDRGRRKQALIVGRHIKKDIALIVGKGFPRQATLQIGAPEIADLAAHSLADSFDDLILEAFALGIGKRHVAGVSADHKGFDLLCAGGPLCRGDLGRRQLIIRLAAAVAVGIFRTRRQEWQSAQREHGGQGNPDDTNIHVEALRVADVCGFRAAPTRSRRKWETPGTDSRPHLAS